MLMARRFHMRVGEQIEIAGVKGNVTRLGLMELALDETDAAGREVYFANSYVFVSPATGSGRSARRHKPRQSARPRMLCRGRQPCARPRGRPATGNRAGH